MTASRPRLAPSLGPHSAARPHSSTSKSWKSSPLLGLLLLGATTLTPVRAHAYAIDIHAELSRQALGKAGLTATATAISLPEADQTRQAIDTFARNDASLKEAWVRRYPQAADFDTFAFKQFLQLSAGSQIYGIDRIDSVLAGATLLEITARGASQPDEDFRNRERYAYDAKRQPLKDSQGANLPADPALLNMGRLGALSSQAHAHYGLAKVEFSDDPDVLKKEPKRFAKKIGFANGPIMTLAAEMAQIHADLALLAALSEGSTATERSWQWTGQGFHYLQDIGNQIHTVQVGLFDFFMDAFTERLKLGLLTGGGYLGNMRSLGSIGIDILTNHHTLSEELTRKRVFAAKAGNDDADAKRLLAAPQQDDADFAKKLDAALGASPEQGEYALAITRTLIDVSSDEGDDVYRATRAIADPKLRSRNVRFDEDHDDPDMFLRKRTPDLEGSYVEFWALQERAFRRVGTALRRWVTLQQQAITAAQTPEQKAALRATVTKRLITRQLKMLDEADARLANYLSDPPKNVTAPERAPEILAIDVVLIGLGIGLPTWVLRRRKRQAAAKK